MTKSLCSFYVLIFTPSFYITVEISVGATRHYFPPVILNIYSLSLTLNIINTGFQGPWSLIDFIDKYFTEYCFVLLLWT